MSKFVDTYLRLLGVFLDGLFYLLGVAFGLGVIAVLFSVLVMVVQMVLGPECIRWPGDILICMP